MGMYTELNFSAEIDYDKHEEIIDVLTLMTDANYDRDMGETFALPDHELFETSRWRHMLLGSSYYFAAEPFCKLNEEHDSKLVSLTVICSLKDYDNEIDKFLDWIRPYVVTNYLPEPSYDDGIISTEPRLFVGHVRYEEDVDPTLVYFLKDKVKFLNVSEKV